MNDRSKDRSMNDSGLESFNEGNLSTDLGEGRGATSALDDSTRIRQTASTSNLSDISSEERRPTVFASSDFSPQRSSYKDCALPINALLPPQKSNPFDVL